MGKTLEYKGHPLQRKDNIIYYGSFADKYIAMLAAKGASYLQSKIETNSFASTINPNALLKYKVDYDVGDRVTCINRQWGVTRDARITEATETWDSSGPGLSITFGESLPTLSETLKWR